MTVLRSATRRWLVLGLAFLALGIIATLRVPSTDATTTGHVVARGFRLDGSECYLTASYSVDSIDYRVDSSRHERWCGYRHDDPIEVHYDSSDPDNATLTPRGGLPTGMIVLGVLGIAGACITATRSRRRRSRRPAGQSGVRHATLR